MKIKDFKLPITLTKDHIKDLLKIITQINHLNICICNYLTKQH